MWTKETVRRLLIALAVAACMALGIKELDAESDDCEGSDPGEDCAVVYYPGICGHLEPYSYWWFYFDCGNEATATSETSSYTLSSDGTRTTEITRTYADGSVIQLVLEQPAGR